MTIVAAADGSALGNPGPAGWAWYVDENCWRAGGWPHGTNNQGELMAVLDLLRSTAHLADEPLLVLCDSQYVINCVSKWMPGWKRKGWRKADGKPVLNVDLLKEIDAAIVGRSYSFEWVKGHAGHDLNEAADLRARAVATAFQNGAAVPSGPGFRGAPAAVPAAVAADAADVPAAAAAPTAGGPMAHPLYELEEPDLFSTLVDEDFVVPGQSPAEQVVALEQELLDPATRTDSSRLAVLLDPDFEEIGASGRMWTRDSMLTYWESEPGTGATMEVLNADQLGEDSVLLTYRSTRGDGSELRSSLWRRSGDQWRLRFHQGTAEG